MNSFETVKQLELELHKPVVRSNAELLGSLLHKSFIECGRSGRFYKKQEILQELLSEESGICIWAQDFIAQDISEGIILLTYKSAHINTDGKLSHHTCRSSLWQHSLLGWQIRFHQGTPTAVFKESSKL